MGCTSSREARRERRRSLSAHFRSQSVLVPSSVGGSSRRVGDSNRHIVALTSSTLGSLCLDDYVVVGGDEMMMKSTNDGRRSAGKEPNVKAWSEMIEAKIPKTPTTPVDETINAWELMAGLEEAEAEAEAKTPPVPEKSASPPKPMWMHASPEEEKEPIVPEFDPDILSNFRKPLDQLSPQHLRSPTASCKPKPEPDDENGQNHLAGGTVKARITAFQQKIDAKRRRKCPPGGEGKVVLYLTSLRGVRTTYEECWGVRVILQGYGVRVDERDVSMHAGFKEELEEVLGRGFGGSRLPRVFANSNYLGGADEVRGMHEAGELARALEECAVSKERGDCEGCGGLRFVPCDNCSGSCKVYVEEEEEEEEVVGVGGFRRCPECNENGLMRCPFCW